MTIGIGDFIAYLIVAILGGLMFGWILGMGDGYKQSREDIRRLQRQMNRGKYQVGDIVRAQVEPELEDDPFFCTIVATYGPFEKFDYRVVMSGDRKNDIYEEDIIELISRRAS